MLHSKPIENGSVTISVDRDGDVEEVSYSYKDEAGLIQEVEISDLIQFFSSELSENILNQLKEKLC